MKEQKMQDERIVTQQCKINNEAYNILLIVLIGSIFIQQYLLNAPFEQYAVELICMFVICLYMLIRYMMHGINIYGEGKRAKVMYWVIIIVVDIAATAINGVLNYAQYSKHYKEVGIGYFIAGLAIFFISITVFSFCIMSFIGYLNKKSQAKIQKQLDKDEQDEFD